MNAISFREREPEDALARVLLDTPIGKISLEGDAEVLVGVGLPSTVADMPEQVQTAGRLPHAVATAARQLGEYFAGDRRAFELDVALPGTAFQRDVWTTLADIPFGETVSYAELAAMVGRPRAYRAVGQANGANPLPIILPCHRVLASGGAIGGYGGGIDTKRRLLAIEAQR